MCKGFLAVIFLVMSPLLLAQQALNNASIIKLLKAGLSEDLVVSTINASPGTYDTSAEGLIALKGAGASDKVVSAVVVRASSGGVAPIPPPAAVMPVNPDDPGTPHEAGIYVYSEAAPLHKMAMLEPSVYSQGKTGGIFTSAMTYGIAKAKVKAVIRNARSNTRVTEPNPVFYFYFEQQGAGLSNASSPFGGTSTPNEYTLLRFDVKENTRETTIGKFNAYGGSGGTDDKATVAFTYTKLGPGAYKVALSAPLKPGEYGFVSPNGAVIAGPYVAGASGSSRVFDFGVN